MQSGIKRGSFPETRWSLVGRAAASDASESRRAISELLSIYAPVLREFLIGPRHLPEEMADDLVQDFVTDRILARRLLRYANRSKGKFRSYLLKSLNNYVNTALKRAYRDRARLCGLEATTVIDAASRSHVDGFERLWARQVALDALTLMKADCKARGREDLWTVFVRRVADPELNDVEPADYAELVQELGISTPRQAMNLLATAKRTYRRHLHAAVARYVEGEDRIEEEIRDLRRIVGA